MRADDLVPLLGSGDEGSEGTRYAQGTIVQWDRATGRNRVSVAGTELQDLPILNTGEAITLRVGHIVGLLRWKSQWFILGRITIPGTGQFAASAVAFDSAGNSRTGFSGPGNWDTPICTASLSVPAWADEAVATVVTQVSMNNTSPNLDNLAVSCFVRVDNGEMIGPGSVITAAISKYWVSLSSSITRTLDVSNASTLSAGPLSINGWAADSGNFASVDFSVMFRAIS